MRSERVIVQVVVLEGKAPAVQMKLFTHLSVLNSPVLVQCGTPPACLGRTRPPDEPLSFRFVWVLRLAVGMLHIFLVGERIKPQCLQFIGQSPRRILPFRFLNLGLSSSCNWLA